MNNSNKIFEHLRNCLNLLRRGQFTDYGHRGRSVILYLLDKEHGLSQRELADLLKVQPSSISEVVNKLMTEGLVTKQQDSDDKRIYKILITEQGQQFLQQKRQKLEQFSAEIFNDFSEEEQTNLANLLEKLTGSLEQHMRLSLNEYNRHHRHHGEHNVEENPRHAHGQHKHPRRQDKRPDRMNHSRPFYNHDAHR